MPAQPAAVKADVPIRREPDSNTKESYHSAQLVPASHKSEAVLEFDSEIGSWPPHSRGENLHSDNPRFSGFGTRIAAGFTFEAHMFDTRYADFAFGRIA